MSNALAKINARIKQLKKASPGISHRTAQKKASAEYKAGKLGKVPAARKAVKPLKKRVTKVKARTVVIAGTRKKKAAPRKKSSGGGGFSIGAIAMGKLSSEVKALERYTRELKKAIDSKQPVKIKNGIRKLIATTKKNITALKRSI